MPLYIPKDALPLGVLPYSELGTAVDSLGNFNLYDKDPNSTKLIQIASINRNDLDQVIEELTRLRNTFKIMDEAERN